MKFNIENRIDGKFIKELTKPFQTKKLDDNVYKRIFEDYKNKYTDDEIDFAINWLEESIENKKGGMNFSLTIFAILISVIVFASTLTNLYVESQLEDIKSISENTVDGNKGNLESVYSSLKEYKESFYLKLLMYLGLISFLILSLMSFYDFEYKKRSKVLNTLRYYRVFYK